MFIHFICKLLTKEKVRVAYGVLDKPKATIGPLSVLQLINPVTYSQKKVYWEWECYFRRNKKQSSPNVKGVGT